MWQSPPSEEAISLSEKLHRDAATLIQTHPDSALVLFRNVVRQRVLDQSNDQDIARTLYNLATTFDGLSMADSAKYYFLRVTELADDRLSAKAFFGMAKLDEQVQAFSSAFEKLDAGLRLTQGAHHIEYLSILLEKGIVMWRQDKSKATSDTIIDLLRSGVEDLVDQREYAFYLSGIYQQIALCHAEKGECDQAASYTYLAQDLDQDPAFNAELLGNLATCYVDQNELSPGRELLDRSTELKLQLYDSLGLNMRNTYDNYAMLHLQEENYAAAYRSCTKAFNCAIPDHEISDLEDLSPEILQRSLDKGRLITYLSRYIQIKTAEYKSGDRLFTEQILDTYGKIDVLIDAILQENVGDLDRFFWRDQVKVIYAGAIEFCLSHNLSEKAWLYFEKAKAQLIREQYMLATSLQIPDSIRRQERQLRSQIEALEDQVALDPTTADELFRLKDSYFSFVRRKRSFAAGPSPIQIRIPSLSEVQSRLAIDQTVLSYFISDQICALAIVEQDTFEMVKLPASYTELQTAVADLRSLIDKLPLLLSMSQEKFQEFDRNCTVTLEELSQMVLPSRNYRSHLSIISDDVLNLVPFSILNKSSKSETNYLIDEHSIDNQLSWAMQDVMKSTGNIKGNWLGIAPRFDASWEDFTPLIHNQTEVQSIENYWNKDASVFYENITDSLIYTWLPSSRIVHFSTHAMVDDRDTDNSALILGATGDPNERLDLAEILIHSNPLDMVVLSACSTGDGMIRRGEGLVSLATAFASTGTQSIVANSWRANDYTASIVLPKFYDELRNGNPRHRALREAVLAYRKETSGIHSHPLFWGGFILIGNNNPLALGASGMGHWGWWIFGLGALLILMWGIRRMTSTINKG